MTADRVGFSDFVAANYPTVVGVVALALRDRDLALDATQEAFARALERWERVRVMARPDGWVYVTAMNVARREQRRGRRELRSSDGDERGGSVDDGVVVRVIVGDALRTLSPRQREAVVLRYAAGLPLSDIADAMGCAVGTVKATLHQALRKMRVDIGDLE
ncbi:MAG TPA: sigma-70 family RNA polymerase sigma factor [Acidimicrobiia bacterium]|jgi:RNA polymerase sigma-70 factor (ECF subfamily)